MKDRKEVKLVAEGQACVELNSRQQLFYDASAGHWWIQIQTDNGGISTVVLKEDVLQEVYRTAWGVTYDEA
jgi:hypothetical protein